MIDTHCHLFWEDFAADLHAVLERSRAAGVHGVIVPGTSLQTSAQAADIACRCPDVRWAAGVHPHDAASLPADFIDRLCALLRHHRAVAVGEIGLDYHYDFCPRDRQVEAFRLQVELALEEGLPVILHNRQADEDLLALCREYAARGLRGQFHCFSSTPAFAERVLELGFHISFTGNVTYRNSTLAEVVRLVPDDRLLLETDAPFMAPVPYRGKRNEPAYLPLIVERLAAIRDQDPETISALTDRNAERLFGSALENVR
ncbi:MAG: TatD family hydrolase [Bacteroidota bacterium]|nr:TatD family hydrolase [Bacteroidota bacterium]